MGKFIDRTGARYGRLVVIERNTLAGPASKGVRVSWKCRCDCGAEVYIKGHELASGDTASCGCLQKETTGALHRTHGMTRTQTYNSWQAAKERCHNPNHEKYPMYGGAGIVMCEEWRASFEAFFNCMGVRPNNTTLDRIDQTKGYEPNNVRWATPIEQGVNSGKTRFYNWAGRQMTLREIAEREGIPRTSLVKNARKMPSIQKAVSRTKERLGRSGAQNLNPPT